MPKPFTPADIPGLALWRQDLPPEAQAYLEYRLKEQAEEDAKAPEPWKPEDGDHLWFLDETCTPVISCHEMPYSDLPVLIKNGNCYRSREEAEKAAERVRKAYRE